MTTTNVN